MTGLLAILVLFSVFSCLGSSMTVKWEWETATATCGRKDVPLATEGACGYGTNAMRRYGYHTTALSTALFIRGSSCGVCFELRCVDHVRWCLSGSPSIIVTTTDFCPPNYALPAEAGGWCNYPNAHFEMSPVAFYKIAEKQAEHIPVQYRRINCLRNGGVRFTLRGSSFFFQVLVSNVGLDGDIASVKVKGSRTGWIPMARNWGQFWHCNAEFKGQPLSFEITSSSSRLLVSHAVAPANWQFGQTYEGKQYRF